MEIQGDLIILPSSNHIPLPWSVRGPLGLETGSEVSIALVSSVDSPDRLPDIIVTPLQSRHLRSTYTLDVELGERAGAVADFLSWFGERIEIDTSNMVNIVLSETITLEGRHKHKMHIVLEPAKGTALDLAAVRSVVNKMADEHAGDILAHNLAPIYNSGSLSLIHQQKVRVENGWLQYDGWMKRIRDLYPRADDEYDLTRVVVSSNPEQRLLRFIVPRNGVVEVRVPHHNTPGALREIAKVVREAGYNILSSRLSRTPPRGFAASTSVFVAACEPHESPASPPMLRKGLQDIESDFMVENVTISSGRPAAQSLYLTPRRREMVQIDPDIAAFRELVRREKAQDFFERYGRSPKLFVFVSRRFIDRNLHKEAFEEQVKTVRKVVNAIESLDCVAIEAPDPRQGANRYDYVREAVFSRLWASDACLVLALDEEGKGKLSESIAHEIGFFAGRNRPLKVLVSANRDQQSVFGNIVGKNRIVYADGAEGFIDEESSSVYSCIRVWLQSLLLDPHQYAFTSQIP